MATKTLSVDTVRRMIAEEIKLGNMTLFLKFQDILGLDLEDFISPDTDIQVYQYNVRLVIKGKVDLEELISSLQSELENIYLEGPDDDDDEPDMLAVQVTPIVSNAMAIQD